MAGAETDTLIIKHLPEELTQDEKEELLRLVGASCVRCMSNRGRLKHTAFATFPSPESARKAMTRLHQLDMLDRRLVVAFSTKENSAHHPSVLDEKALNKESTKTKDGDTKTSDLAPDRKRIARKLESLAPKWGFEYPLDPSLEYMYPAPTVTILTNIANALASVPRFYVQVLHLMNKMNLPAPFGMLTPTPPLPEDEPVPPPPPTEPCLPPEPQDSSTTEESELESENEDERVKQVSQVAVKRPATKNPNRPKKRHKLQKVVAAPLKPSQGPVHKPDEVFEQPTAPKKLGFAVNLSSRIAESFRRPQQPLESPVLSTEPQLAPSSTAVQPNADVQVQPVGEQQAQPPPVDLLSVVENQPQVEEGGFGKLEPLSQEGGADEDEENMEEEEDWGAGKFISSRRLRKGRISSSQMRDFSVFRNYQAGEPTSRLYIKNLSKQVTEKDLHYVFGRYVDWDKEEEKIMFDIRLMTEGRMKGQAFVTLPGANAAKEAVHDTNGFLLEGKPMVVQFARSAKPKDKEPEKGSKDKKQGRGDGERKT